MTKKKNPNSTKKKNKIQTKYNPMDEEMFEWICVAKDPEIKDGIMIDIDERQKFEKELGLDVFNIMDEIDALTELVKGYTKELEKKEDIIQELMDAFHKLEIEKGLLVREKELELKQPFWNKLKKAFESE